VLPQEIVINSDGKILKGTYNQQPTQK